MRENMNSVSATKTMVREKSSDYDRWANLANHKVGWEDRTRQMVRLIAPGTSVFEFGAGRCHLEKMLPENCSYTPSDLVSRGALTYI